MSVVCLHAWFRFCSSILSLFWFSHNWVNKLKYSILRYSVMLARVLSARHKDVFYSAGLWMASLRTFSDSLFSRFITIFTQNSLRAEAQLCFVLLRVLAWRVIRSLCQSEVTGAVLIAKVFYPQIAEGLCREIRLFFWWEGQISLPLKRKERGTSF